MDQWGIKIEPKIGFSEIFMVKLTFIMLHKLEE